MEKLILASNNKGKIKEFKEIIGNKFEIVSLAEVGFLDDIEENGNTFFENALIKAKTVSRALNCNAIADDSGLCVEALNGEPGILSARFSGVHGNDKANNELLLKKLEGEKNRNAKFVSSIVLYKVDDSIVSGYGETCGEIMNETCGENGFGYDPLFFSLDLNKSFGDATSEEKNSISHRRRALNDLLAKL